MMKTISDICPDFYSNPIKKDWFYNICKIDNPFSETSPQRSLYAAIFKQDSKTFCNALEFGVFRGHTLIPTAIALKLIGSPCKVFGFDTFTGFPDISYSDYDQPSFYNQLYEDKSVSRQHFDSINISRQLKENILQSSMIDASNISSSADFSSTSKALLEEKIHFFELDNVTLVDGLFENTLPHFDFSSGDFGLINIDSDLYSTYELILSFLPMMTSSIEHAFVFLDEYFSLKFPGPRVAIDKYLSSSSSSFRLQQLPSRAQEFERWSLVK